MGRRKPTEPEGKVELTSAPFESTPQPAVEGRVKALERVVAALVFSTFAARDSKGHMLVRCRCGCFATRQVSISHPREGIKREQLCDECELWTPFSSEGLPQSEAEILEPADRAHVARVNKGLVEARQWGGS